MLASTQYTKLLTILSELNTKFEDISAKFRNTFNKWEGIRISWIIQYLLIHNVSLLS